MENSNRNLYIVIAVAVIAILGIIFFLESTELSSDDVNATVDARVALILTDADFDATSQAQIADFDATSQAQLADFDATSQAQLDDFDTMSQAQLGDFDATSQAQVADFEATNQADGTQIAQNVESIVSQERELVLTDVAEAYPSNTPSPIPTATPSPTATDPFRSQAGLEFWDTSELVIASATGDFNKMLWSADSQTIFADVYTGETHELRFYDRDLSDDYQVVGTTADYANDMKWSPDGRYIAIIDTTRELYVVDVMAMTMVDTTSITDLEIEVLAWTPDSAYLIGTSEEAVYSMDGTTFKELDDDDLEETSYNSLSFYPDEPLLLATQGDGVQLFEVQDDGDLDSIDSARIFQSILIDEIRISPTGDLLAMTEIYENSIHIWSIAPEESPLRRFQNVLPNYGDFIITMEWSPNSEFLVAAGEDNVARIWYVRESRLIYDLNHGTTIWDAQWANDGTLGIATPNGLYLWSLALNVAE